MPGTSSDRDGSHRLSPADSELGWKVRKSQLELNPGVHGGFGMLHSAHSTWPTRALARTHPIPPRACAADQGFHQLSLCFESVSDQAQPNPNGRRSPTPEDCILGGDEPLPHFSAAFWYLHVYLPSCMFLKNVAIVYRLYASKY